MDRSSKPMVSSTVSAAFSSNKISDFCPSTDFGRAVASIVSFMKFKPLSFAVLRAS